MSVTQTLGQQAEQSAERFLLQQGMQLITRNFQCRLGEIDLIMQDRDFLVFVEVRYRHSSHYGSGAETVTWFKQKKIIRTAKYYLQQQQLLEKMPCRFDVVTLASAAKEHDIAWIKSAFELQ